LNNPARTLRPRLVSAKSLRMTLQRLVRTWLWGMDIDRSTWIEPSAYIDRTWPRGIHIGPQCYIGEESVVLTHDMTRGIYVHTRIGARCHLGARAIVLPGLTIGDDSVIMPGALVTKDMPSNSIAIGNPALIEPRSKQGPGSDP
jgi:acetyltransferase-like isoleucine patch superfamily enzyme